MPTNLRKAQQDAINSGFLNQIGENKFEIAVATNLLEQYGEEFAHRRRQDESRRCECAIH